CWWSVGESVSEVDLEGAERCCPDVAAAPGALGALDGEVDELGGGLFVGERAAGLDRFADLAVEALDAVDVLPARPPGLGDHWVAGAPLGVEGFELGEGVV